MQTVKKKAEKVKTIKDLGRKRKIRLNSICDIRRFLARVTNELDGDLISDGKARSLGYLCNIMKDVIRDGDLEARIVKLEQETVKHEND